MSSRLPSRRFREVQLLVGAAIVVLVAVAVAELQGILALARAVEEVGGANAAALARRWRWIGGALALVVGGGSGMLAWLLVSRLLGPYRELMTEARRVTAGVGGQAEDRFLIEAFRDTVTRLETSEAALRQRADELSVLAGVLTRESGSGVVVADAQGLVRAANATAVELLGAPLTVGAIVPPALETANGRLELAGRPVEIRRVPLRSAEGVRQGDVVFLADRTRVEALERALAEREQMAALGELAAGLTHELRNALATISGYVRLLEAAEGEARARYLAAVGREATSLGTVLERFLRFAEPRELRREPVDLMSLAGDVASRVVAALPGTKVTVAGVAAPLRVDRLAVGVAIENLVRNAVEAVTATGGSVSLSISADRSRAVVEVEDDGPGVGDDVRGRLFSPFATSKSSGGLGLALARRLARLHGGDVTYEPRASGGSRFTLVLPREDEP